MMATLVVSAAAWLVLVTCLVQGAKGVWQPQLNSNPQSSLSPRPSWPENDFAKTRATWRPDSSAVRNEDTYGLSLIQEPGSAAASPSSTSQRGLMGRFLARFRRGNRAHTELPAAEGAPARPRLSLRQRLAQRFRQARATIGGVTSAIRIVTPRLVSGLRRRLQAWWRRGQRDPSFPDSEPEDLVVRLELQQRSSRLEALQKETLGDSVESPVAVVPLVSASKGGTQQQVRIGPLYRRGERFLVYLAEDVDTGEQFVLKVMVVQEPSEAVDVTPLEAEASCLQKMPKIKSPQEARDRYRFLVAEDTLTVAGEAPLTVTTVPFAELPVVNYFLRMPRASTDLLTYLQVMQRIRISWLTHSLLQSLVTLHVLRLAANLQMQGVVHGNFTADNLFLMPDGRVLLGGFGNVRKNGTRGPVAAVKPTHAPPDFIRGGATAKYTFALDAWQLGLAIYQMWCYVLPFGLNTPDMEEAGGRPSMRVPGNDKLDFDKCHGPPAGLEPLVGKLLRFRGWHRMLALTAFRSEVYQMIKLEFYEGLVRYLVQEREEFVSRQPEVPAAGTSAAEGQQLPDAAAASMSPLPQGSTEGEPGSTAVSSEPGVDEGLPPESSADVSSAP